MGLHVAALDVAQDKLDLATELGADLVANCATEDAIAQGGRGDGWLRARGARHRRVARRRGTVALVGLPPATSRRPSSMWC
jgi:propanol-preferring alcohol dehydrogenase